MGTLFFLAMSWACAPGSGPGDAGDPPGPANAATPANTVVAARPDEPEDVQPEPAPEARPAAPDSGSAWVIFGADTVVAEVAATGDARTRGLQGRDSVPAGTGMLFVYPERDVRSFWMVGTTVALDIAFLDAVEGEGGEGAYRVVDIQSMEPETSTLHTSSEPAVMALEVARGWFAEHEVEVGAVASVVWGGR